MPLHVEGSASIAFAEGQVSGRGPAVRMEARARIGFKVRARGTDYRLVLVQPNGERIAELESAVVESVTWALNEHGSIEFSMGQADPKISAVGPMSEVQLWRGNMLMFWGVVTRVLATGGEVRFTVEGLTWYFSRRHFGKADRTNYLDNGDFEAGLDGWGVGHYSPLEPLAGRDPSNWLAGVSGEKVLTGSRALRLEQPDVFPLLPRYGVAASLNFLWEVPDGAESELWSLVGYAFIPSASFVNANGSNLGMRLARFSTTDTIEIFPEDGGPSQIFPAPIEETMVRLDADTPQDRWVRFSIDMEQPPTGGVPEFVQVALGAPVGVVFWDRISLTLQEATRFRDEDQASIVAGIVEHLQDSDYSKSDLLIETETPPTGVRRDRTYVHSDHPNGWAAIQSFTQLRDGMDVSMEVTPTRRTLTTHYPEKGRRLDLILEEGRNVASYTWAFDGQALASQVIVLGTGDGSAREEGWASEDSWFGVSLEEIVTAEDGTAIETLDDLAAERLRLVAFPEIVEVETFEGQGSEVIEQIRVGDRVRVILGGYANVDEVYRVVRITLTPGSDACSLALNPYREEE